MRMSAVPRLDDRAAHEVEDLGLDRHVERGRRLVGDEQLRVAGEGHGDHHALAHPAAELVRVVVEAAARRRDADQLEQLDGPIDRAATLQLAVRLEHLGQLALDGEDRVQRGHRVLEDHRHAVAPDLAHRLLAAGRGCPRRRTRISPARDLRRRLRQQAHQRQRADALAAARLAHDAERLAAGEVVADAVDGVDGALAGSERDAQVADRQQRVVDSAGGWRIIGAASGRAIRACRRRAG